LAATGVLVSLQNSLNDEWIAPIIGYQRDVPSVVELAAQILGPGNVKRRTGPTKAWFALGEMHGRVTPRVQELAKILGAAGKTEVTSNIWGAKWSKLIVNTMSHAIAAILRGTDSDVVENPKLFPLGIALGRECLDVGLALGYRIEPVFGLSAEDMMGAPDEVLKQILVTLCKHIGKHTNSFLQDMMKGRPSEVHYMNGLVAAKGREAGIPTPFNDEITRIVEQIERGELTFGPEHLEQLENLVPSKRAIAAKG
jgi:2-dehydropantoate 2-reductase